MKVISRTYLIDWREECAPEYANCIKELVDDNGVMRLVYKTKYPDTDSSESYFAIKPELKVASIS